MVGVAETQNTMASKIRCDFPQIGAHRPSCSVNEKAHGGVALLAKKGAKQRLLFKHAEKSFQMIIALVLSITIAVVYLAPSASDQEEDRCLNMLQTHARGPTLAMGDLNARNKSWWDKMTNARGRKLERWAHRFGWETSALRSTPSFVSSACSGNRSRTGTSNIDLILTKLLTKGSIYTAPGAWESNLQHKPACMSLPNIPSNMPDQVQKCLVSVKRFSDKNFREKVRDE